jgi:hypothetical protein
MDCSMKTCLLSASCGLLLLLFSIAPSPVLASNLLQQDTSAKQDAKDAGASTKNAAKKTGSATKKETKKVVDDSDASKKPETTPKQDIKSAGSSTKEATKKTGSAAKKETKKVVNKSAEKTDEGAKKVEDKTQPK